MPADVCPCSRAVPCTLYEAVSSTACSTHPCITGLVEDHEGERRGWSQGPNAQASSILAQEASVEKVGAALHVEGP